MSDLNRWMQKHNLCPENILYLYRPYVNIFLKINI